MTTLWKLGSDIDEAAAAMKSLPTFNFNARPLPATYSVISRTVKDQKLQNLWTARGIYCPVCFTVSKDLGLFAKDNTAQRGDRDSLYIEWRVVLHELVKSAEADCFFCMFMICRFFNDPQYSYVWTNALPTNTNPVSCCPSAPVTERRSSKVQKAIDTVRKLCDQYEGENEAYVKLIAQPLDFVEKRGFCKLRFQAAASNLSTQDLKSLLGFRREIVLELYATDTDDSTASYLKHDPPIMNPRDATGLAQVQRWISNCFETHNDCSKPWLEILPTRTIEILNDKEVKIRSDHRRDAYVTLSYCWGGPQPLATTLAVLRSRHSAFKISNLPASIQDAIYITNNLGLRHLWVDSICIAQDSAEDKDRELNLMASYYRNSFITICAGAGRCTLSFLTKRARCKQHADWNAPRDLLPMKLLGPDGSTGFALFGEENPYSWSREPISTRAWTFQEQILSPRMVMYGNRMLWKCRSAQHSAGGVEDWSTDIRNNLDRSISAVLTDYKDQNQSRNKFQTDAKDVRQLFDTWYLAVKEFSYRSLTFDHDKFPAISALAGEFHGLLNDDYLAGLWRGDFLRGLLWSTYPDINPKQPDMWRAPSWSWASTNSVVSFDRLPLENTEQVAEIVNCTTTLKNPAVPFGEIIDAVLEIKAPVAPGDVKTTMRMLERDNHIPRQSDTLNYRLDMADMMLRGVGVDPGAAPWVVPADHIMVVLFARRLPSDKTQILTNFRKANSTESIKGLDIEKAKEVAVLFGLILIPAASQPTPSTAYSTSGQERMAYRRIGRFMDFKIQGFENLRLGSNTRIVSIV